jgi:hypothetical protein
MDLFDGQAAGARPIVPRYARDFGLTDASGIADEVVPYRNAGLQASPASLI